MYRYAAAHFGWARPKLTLRRAEVSPGELAEVDFGQLGKIYDPESDRNRLVWALLVTLGFSRHQYVHVSFSQKLDVVIDGLEEAWEFFGGVPLRVVVDNMKTAVVKSDRYEPIFQRTTEQYAEHRGFVIDPAVARHPTGKPIVERGVQYVRESFFRGEQWLDLAHVQREARRWCMEVAGRRIHGTTQKRPLVPPIGVFRHRRTRRAPYIWTQQEVTLLLQAAARLEPQGSLRPHMYSTLFALLYVTGLRISEALALEFDDFDSETLLVRKTKFKKSRRIPLHQAAVAGLHRYLEHRRRVTTEHKLLFMSVRGRRLDQSSVGWVFRRLLKTIGLNPGQHGRRPRIHDLRHTFATRALETCPEGRDSIGRHMLALSTYLGHTHISDTYWYLEATPTLMQDIASSCEAFIQREKQ